MPSRFRDDEKQLMCGYHAAQDLVEVAIIIIKDDRNVIVPGGKSEVGLIEAIKMDRVEFTEWLASIRVWVDELGGRHGAVSS